MRLVSTFWYKKLLPPSGFEYKQQQQNDSRLLRIRVYSSLLYVNVILLNLRVNFSILKADRVLLLIFCCHFSVSGCNASYLNHSNNSTVEPEPGRCRRTDGKKWRCKSAVLPGQKYCATHMHRGAKRRFTNNESPPSATGAATTATITSEVTIARLPYPSAATNIQKAYCTIPNTKLSMSVPESEPFIKCNEKSGSCSDTDTSTTITDTINECSYVSF